MPGPTNCEKITLMRAISQEKVDGFFKHDELVTIFVEHDVEERGIEPSSAAWPLGKLNNDLNGIEFVVKGPLRPLELSSSRRSPLGGLIS